MQFSFSQKYQDGDFVRFLKAKTLFGFIIATIIAAFVALSHNYFVLSQEETKTLLAPIGCLVVILGLCLPVLLRGYFQLVANIVFFATTSIIWYIMFHLERNSLSVVGTIVYMYAALSMIPLIIGKKRRAIFIYLSFTLVVFLLFSYFKLYPLGFETPSILSFIFDNVLSMTFVAFISFLIIIINDKALSRAEDEIEKNRQLSMTLEAQVVDRTKDLHAAQDELITAAHHAGKAEIATGVLHNIGNVLTGVFVNVDTLHNTFSETLIKNIQKVSDAISQAPDRHRFLLDDEKGKKIPDFIVALGPLLQKEHKRMSESLQRIEESIELIKDSVRTQQAYAHTNFMAQEIDLVNIIESMIALTIGDVQRRGVIIEKNFTKTKPLIAEKEKVGHIIANLIKNAFESFKGVDTEKKISISVFEDTHKNVVIEIADTGQGVKRENLDRIFSFGFTTKVDGHGFGLHHCANAMTEMGGALSVTSDGEGKGARFQMVFYAKDKKGTQISPRVC